MIMKENNLDIREVLHYFALKYEGNVHHIIFAIITKEVIRQSDYDSIIAQDKTDFITLLDEIGEEKLSTMIKPPLVMFYKGNIELMDKLNYKEFKEIEGIRTQTILQVKTINNKIYLDYLILSENVKVLNHLIEKITNLEAIKSLVPIDSQNKSIEISIY